MYIEIDEVVPCDDNMIDSRQWSSTWKGAVAGAAGGLIASWVMNQFQSGVSKLSEEFVQDDARPKSGGDEETTVKTAEAISEAAGHRLTQQEKQVAAPLVHYAFGSTMGALYGIAAELNPHSGTGWGAPFGAALWLGADELAVPVLGLSGAPTDTPISTHASALAAHVVYGVTTEVVRRAVRSVLH